ncbi:MAG: regulatory protein RecX [Candidatus Omnitrophica bacterium]|nr:regulatory protein RecX [Candidatus Omnitrophota bacterium]
MKKSADDFAKAKEYAYRLLKYRERSTKEIERRLKEKHFSGNICDKVIAELKELGYLDDNRFANMVADSIIKFKPGGLALVRSALYAKGVPAKIIDSVISDVKDGYDEYEAAYALASRRVRRFKDIEPERAKHRIYNLLLRRRFKQETILEVLNQIFK